jgi:O-methyltransferase
MHKPRVLSRRSTSSVLKRAVLKVLELLGYTVVKVGAGKGKAVRVAMQVQAIEKNYRILARAELHNRISHLNGSIIEAGVAGGSGLATFVLLEDLRKSKRKIWAFDSFSGFPSGSNADSLVFQKFGKPAYKDFTEDWVMDVLVSIPLSVEILENITLCKGFMPQSFNQYDLGPVALLNVDVDLYQSTKDVLEYFWPMMESTGVVILDEYDSDNDSVKWPGAKKAIDEFCEVNQVKVQRSIGNRAFLMKP